MHDFSRKNYLRLTWNMLLIWMIKNYSENENGNSKSVTNSMEKTMLDYKNSHLILNKYG